MTNVDRMVAALIAADIYPESWADGDWDQDGEVTIGYGFHIQVAAEFLTPYFEVAEEIEIDGVICLKFFGSACNVWATIGKLESAMTEQI